MKPKHQNKRLITMAIVALAVVSGAYLLLGALGDNKQLFVNPSDVVAATYVQGENKIKIGGMVVEGSVVKVDGLNTSFSVINFENPNPDIPALKVTYNDVLPDLFGEGQGVVMTGKLLPNGIFAASNVLAKHDENYMPKMPDS
ncbi:MAG: cytochrome c biogenesis protein CcmE [Robiginitomaculum sp.]|nr:MAG: cytochrome c biogenesis protein CcmE [Robiginitomaculum sp.]